MLAAMDASSAMRVLLVPGLGRSPLSLALLARRLSQAGYRPEHFFYSPFFESHSRIQRRMIARLAQLAALGDEVALIGHSFGGLILREAAAQVAGLRVKHFVMLGTPNQPPRLGARAWRWLPYRAIRRSCGYCLANPDWFERLPPIRMPYTVIAGTAGCRGGWGMFPDELNDGIVSLSETAIAGGAPPVPMPVVHTFMMNDRDVFRLIDQCLRQNLGASPFQTPSVPTD
jgi:pimeloyl-ACP methyl ester carboxylesterase